MTASSVDVPLVVGAGPVGLAASLFLARKGISVRLIDQAAERSPWSRALAVNPRTLELLRPTGVADRIEQLGRRVRGAQLWRNSRAVRQIDFAEVDGQRPHLVALSQAVSERLLRDAFQTLGGTVETGTALAGCEVLPDGPHVTLSVGERTTTCRPPWVFAADGSRSVTRHALGVEMEGDQLQTPWHLVDVPLDTSMPADRANLIFLPRGFVFALPVITDATAPGSAPIWRLMGNTPDPLGSLPIGRAAGEPIWTSTFHIAHRSIARQPAAPVYFGGDAAHVHSPVGARGMNLGIEDAWCFAELMAVGRANEYGRLRRDVDQGVVRRIRRVTQVVIGESPITRLLRGLMPAATRIGAVRRLMTRMLTGLDHPLTPAPSRPAA